MLVEAGLVEGGSRTSSTFFGGGNAVDEFKDAARLRECTISRATVPACPTDRALVSKFGTLSRAWRLGLDVDGSGKMDMREFCEVSRGSPAPSDAKPGQVDCCHMASTISFDELDRKAAASLEKFRVMSLMHHESIHSMWKALKCPQSKVKAVMDKDRSNHVGLPLFLEGCKALGYEDEEEAAPGGTVNSPFYDGMPIH
eukprot:Skav200388  [mRNA]  locus=scaffold2518:469066:471100:- [translate_table: standard]